MFPLVCQGRGGNAEQGNICSGDMGQSGVMRMAMQNDFSPCLPQDARKGPVIMEGFPPRYQTTFGRVVDHDHAA
ncbi:hypothetical protein AA3271_2390 [Gluconobacter japonicus NBRC 3271]|nr:hypothetical protein AA3271_2390 [Gluconobacter japonicus NBRC 3271]